MALDQAIHGWADCGRWIAHKFLGLAFPGCCICRYVTCIGKSQCWTSTWIPTQSINTWVPLGELISYHTSYTPSVSKELTPIFPPGLWDIYHLLDAFFWLNTYYRLFLFIIFCLLRPPWKHWRNLHESSKIFFGASKLGGRKTPLVAWDRLCKPKELGGLGFKHLAHHSIALLSKWVLAALDNPTSEWSLLFMQNIHLGNWSNIRQLRRHHYSATDRILLGDLKNIWAMPYSIGIWGV